MFATNSACILATNGIKTARALGRKLRKIIKAAGAPGSKLCKRIKNEVPRLP